MRKLDRYLLPLLALLLTAAGAALPYMAAAAQDACTANRTYRSLPFTGRVRSAIHAAAMRTARHSVTTYGLFVRRHRKRIKKPANRGIMKRPK